MEVGGGGNWGAAGVRRRSADCGGGEEEDNDDDKEDDNDKDGVEYAKDAVPPGWPQGLGGGVKSLGSPVHPRVILPPREGGWRGGEAASIPPPLGPHARLP